MVVLSVSIFMLVSSLVLFSCIGTGFQKQISGDMSYGNMLQMGKCLPPTKGNNAIISYFNMGNTCK